MNEVAKRNNLFPSIHCEAVVYSKQYCLWNWSLFGNGTVSAQKTVIAVNCRWEQDVQGKKTLIKSATYFNMNEVAKRNTLFTSIPCEESVYFKQYCLYNCSLIRSGTSVQRRQSLKCFVIENKTFKVKTLIKSATYFTHERSCKKKHFVYKHSFWRECLF